jgi:exo-beta-1,3-glucanase (GH17 family)
MSRPQSFSIVAWLAVLCALMLLGWWLPNRRQDPGVGTHAVKFNSLSYAPYRTGQSPLTGRFATEAEVDQDMALLAPLTRAIRSYAAIEGPYEGPALARKHGLKLWQGIWLGGDRAQNAREMARAIDFAHRYPDTIERVIVGNEVLLRRDLPVAELIADIDHVRASVKQPVAYADVSDFWDQFVQVAPHVDVVLIHLLPYWEDVPTGIDHAVEKVGQAYIHFTKLFPGKTIAIGETGWPSRGRQRRDAVPGRINEARFLREFIALSEADHFEIRERRDCRRQLGDFRRRPGSKDPAIRSVARRS